MKNDDFFGGLFDLDGDGNTDIFEEAMGLAFIGDMMKNDEDDGDDDLDDLDFDDTEDDDYE